MKQINTYINEKLRLSAKPQYTCQPKSKYELQEIILQRISDEGPQCDLNDIDTSKITDMSDLFATYDNKIFNDFNGDISQWNVSNVEHMEGIFSGCEQFSCDISQWDVSNVKRMEYMFNNCKQFDCDLSKWDVSKVEKMNCMFCRCENFNQDLNKWDVSNVENMRYMFWNCKKFNQNLDSWDVSNVKDMLYAFEGSLTKPTWYDKNKWK